ncbi:MAG: hypothetical protein HY862_00835 [Chloroflexi bacterium]|nr:hypothetical protein [Chloroflexota bacterium]
MSIGRVGKQAQQAAQQQQRRYQMNYGPAVGGNLQPPMRSRPATSVPSEDATETIQRVPMDEPLASDTVEQAVMPEMVQRADDPSSGGNEGATNSDPKISPKDVAERVYALFVRDIKREQERLGTFRKIR